MLTPREYQAEAIEAAARRNILLADQCGLGKTLQAIEAAKTLQERYNAPVLFIVTKSIKAQWVKALCDQGIVESDIVLLDSKGFSSIVKDRSFVVTHYDAVVKWVSELSRMYFSLIVADEAHKLRNRKIKRVQAVKDLKAHRKLAMTGTPWDGDPAQVWSILNWLDPQFYRSYWRFYEAHVNYTEQVVNRSGRRVKLIKDKRNPLSDPANFARVMRRNMIRRTKAEVRADLPPRIDQIVPIELETKQARIYRTVAEADDVITRFEEGIEVLTPIVLTYVLRLIQITTDPALLGFTDVPSAKLEWVEEWVEANGASTPFIIFTRFRDTANKIAEVLRGLEEPIDPLLITGGSKRPAVTSDHRAIVGTIAAMGEGLDLPHISVAIFVDCEWSSILMQQAIDRIHRINITEAKQVYYLQARGTIDEYVYNVVTGKWTTQDLAFEIIKGLKGSGNV